MYDTTNKDESSKLGVLIVADVKFSIPQNSPLF